MFAWLKSLLSPTPKADVRVPVLEREAQALRLELQEQRSLAMQLHGELEAQRAGEAARIRDAVHAELEPLVAELAGPLAQLLTQAHLVEAEGKALTAKDVLAVARRLVRALEERGLQVEAAVGSVAPFDPDRHDPLDASVFPSAGSPVVVRFAALSYGGKILRRAGVEPVEGPA